MKLDASGPARLQMKITAPIQFGAAVMVLGVVAVHGMNSGLIWSIGLCVLLYQGALTLAKLFEHGDRRSGVWEVATRAARRLLIVEFAAAAIVGLVSFATGAARWLPLAVTVTTWCLIGLASLVRPGGRIPTDPLLLAFALLLAAVSCAVGAFAQGIGLAMVGLLLGVTLPIAPYSIYGAAMATADVDSKDG